MRNKEWELSSKNEAQITRCGMRNEERGMRLRE